MKFLKNTKRYTVLDANVILRYLLNDHNDLSKRAVNIISSNKCIVFLEVVAEVIYVMQGVYAIERNDIRHAITELSNDLIFDKYEILEVALKEYCNTPKKDFVDCLLYGYYQKGYKVSSFDKKLNILFN